MKQVGHFLQFGKKVNVLEENGEFYEQLDRECFVPLYLSRGRKLSRRTPENVGWREKSDGGFYLPSEVFRLEEAVLRHNDQLETVMKILEKEFKAADEAAIKDIQVRGKFLARRDYEQYYNKFSSYWDDDEITLEVFCVTYGTQNFLTESELKTALRPWHEMLVRQNS